MTRPDSTPPKQFLHTLVDVHGNYRSGRQAHQPPDELITDEVTPRVLRPHVVRSSAFFAAAVATFLLIFLCLFLSLVAGIIEAFSTSFSGQQDSGASGFFAAVAYLMIVLLLLLLVAWIVALFVPLSEPIAEYSLLIEGRAQVAPVAYWWIMHTITQRQTPFDVQFGRIQATPVMLLSHSRLRGLIVVRAHGADLYLGWTMWRGRSTMVAIGNLIRDMFRGAGIGSLHGDIRDSVNRAMRELIHSVTREGVQAAILEPPVAEPHARAAVDQLPDLDLPVMPTGQWPARPPPQVPQPPVPQSPVPQSPVPEPQPASFPAPPTQATAPQTQDYQAPAPGPER